LTRSQQREKKCGADGERGARDVGADTDIRRGDSGGNHARDERHAATQGGGASTPGTPAPATIRRVEPPLSTTPLLPLKPYSRNSHGRCLGSPGYQWATASKHAGDDLSLVQPRHGSVLTVV